MGKILDLAAVYRETRKHIEEQAFPRPQDPIVHEFQHSSEFLNEISAGRKGRTDLEGKATCSCRYAISTDDSVSAAVRISIASGCTPFALNFASKNLPGGAVASGVLAQEESIFRQTALALALPPGSHDPGAIRCCQGEWSSPEV
eukprot:gnl/TRDRNA2_/TRDRNA2_63124_c0_seq1.p1 gnl/TRDRNA2_/TRDRNA2_63124_c0~~gnl/TRDRNA2_/TRDRNA2_63124_c0_seq1.p1  ORF type:complete len:145 (-),score=20.39 gnl/TRDRNA2_/TRDRNA2_63124_c0_seq1:240-674(-)